MSAFRSEIGSLLLMVAMLFGISALVVGAFFTERGTVVGVTGPSGSGKSSLLAVAATLIRPDSGSVVIDDIDVTRLSPSERAKLRRELLARATRTYAMVDGDPNEIKPSTVESSAQMRRPVR